MIKIKDNVALGAAAGIIGSIPQSLLNLLSKMLGISKTYSFTLAGGIFLGKKHTSEIGSFILGTVLWIFTAAFIGYLIVLLMKKTGRDLWWFKGPLVTILVMNLFIFGFMFSIAATTVIPKDVATNLSILVENLVFGVVTGYLIARWIPETDCR